MAEDRGIWATWYDLPEEEEAEYLSWLHGEHIPAARQTVDSTNIFDITIWVDRIN